MKKRSCGNFHRPTAAKLDRKPAIPCVAASMPLPTYYIIIGQFNKLLYFMSGGPPIDPMKHIGLDCYTNAMVEPLSLHFAWPLTWFCSIEQLELRSVLPGFMGLLPTSHSKWHSLTYPSERMGALRPSLVYSAPKQTPFRSKCSHIKNKAPEISEWNHWWKWQNHTRPTNLSYLFAPSICCWYM